MNNSTNKFVVAKKKLTTPEKGVVVEKGDIGMMTSEGGKHSSVFFIRIWKNVHLGNDDFKYIDVQKTGDGFSKKICNVCHKLKKTTEFARNQNAKNNRPVRRPSCKDCRIITEGVNVPRAEKLKWLKIKPENEPFECPICKKKTIAGVTSKIVLEHDHQTGKAGGWICDSCNTGLGRFKDDVELLKSAIDFLEKNY